MQATQPTHPSVAASIIQENSVVTQSFTHLALGVDFAPVFEQLKSRLRRTLCARRVQSGRVMVEVPGLEVGPVFDQQLDHLGMVI